MDMGGNVVGVIVSKLSAIVVVQATGDVPQNVNFAIKRRMVEEFLDTNNVDYKVGGSGGDELAADIADRAEKFTVKVECLN